MPIVTCFIVPLTIVPSAEDIIYASERNHRKRLPIGLFNLTLQQVGGAQKQECEGVGDCYQSGLGLRCGLAVAVEALAHPCLHCRRHDLSGYLYYLPPIWVDQL